MQKTHSKLFKFAILGALAIFTMGNEGCQDKNARKLKKRASLSKISAQKMRLPDGTTADFEYLANAQIYDVIAKNNEFILPYGGNVAQTAFAETKMYSLADQSNLSQWQNRTSNDLYFKAAVSSSVPECLRRLPQVELAGVIESFEVVGGGGMTFGYGPNVNPKLPPTSASLNVQFAQLTTNLQSYHPLTRIVNGSGRANGTHTKMDLNLTIDLGLFKFGPKAFFQSPLANVSHQALSKTLQFLAADYDKRATEQKRPLWETQVRNDDGDHVIIYGGRVHGLKVGDELAIFTQRHLWENNGTPCATKYEGALRTSDLPVALIRIEGEQDLGDEIARARITQKGSGRPEEGAQVVIYKFAAPQK